MSNKPSVILVGPQLSENIGAVARVMRNFCLDDLRLVYPRQDFSQTKAEAVAAGASDIIQTAQIYNQLSDSLHDIEFLYAATCRTRDLQKEVTFAHQLKGEVSGNHKLAIMFGRENNGLTNEELSLADKIVTIDVNEAYSSLNLAQAVGIIAYELFYTQQDNSEVGLKKSASKQELYFFLDKLDKQLEDNNFYRVPEKKQQIRNKLTNLFMRIPNLSVNELHILHGILEALKKK